jgi:hypothetical protein
VPKKARKKEELTKNEPPPEPTTLDKHPKKKS